MRRILYKMFVYLYIIALYILIRVFIYSFVCLCARANVCSHMTLIGACIFAIQAGDSMDHLMGESHNAVAWTRNKKLLGAKGIATGSKDATRGSWPYY